MHMICYFINLTKLLFFIWQMITSRAADCNCTNSNAGQIPTIDFLLLYFVQLSSFIYCIYGCLCALYLTSADLYVMFFVCQFADEISFFFFFFEFVDDLGCDWFVSFLAVFVWCLWLLQYTPAFEETNTSKEILKLSANFCPQVLIDI